MKTTTTNTGMKTSGKMIWRQALGLAGFLLLVTLAASASSSVFVTVTDHSEEALTWCGAATGQMVMTGYPAGACIKDQADVDASIQSHKVESNWDTDPAGLRDAMMELCPPSGHWVVFAQPDAASLMHSVAYWMNTNHYPVAALLNTAAHNSYAPHQEHWVTIKGIVTDLDPRTNPTVTLQYVFFVDQPVALGDPPIDRFVSGATWYGEFAAVTKSPSAYQSKFVAVIEPPPSPGRAVAAGKLLVTGRVISRAEAVRFAREWVEKLKLREVETFREFAGSKPLEPLLVNAEEGGYYLVPFSADQKAASLAVIVNAYDGAFEEAGRFAPRTFLPERAALEHVRNLLKLKRPLQPQEYKTALVSSPETGTRYQPEWRITTHNRVLTVGQHGEIHLLEPQKPSR